LLLCNVFGLRTFLALDDFKFNVITLLQALVALRLDGAVVDKHIRAVFPADKAEALCVVKPFHFTFDSRHDPCSELSWRRSTDLPGLFIFSKWVFLLSEKRRAPEVTFSLGFCVVNHNFDFDVIFPRLPWAVNTKQSERAQKPHKTPSRKPVNP
jgi:hypothetical protein